MSDVVLEHVAYSYRTDDGPIPALCDVSLELTRGQHYQICGPSGSGKSTLSLLLAGLIVPDSGTATFRSAAALRPAYVFQFPEQLFFCDTVRAEFAETHGDLDSAGLTALLYEFGLDDPVLLERNPYHLSMGYARLTALALQIARDPGLLIVDEPTIGLDEVHARLIIRILRQWISAKRILVIVTHDLELIREIGGTCLVMANGGLIWRGPCVDLLNRPPRLREFGLSE
jgi:energy-coupling factor transporter ATP-binding protein EcfA2